MEGPLGCDPGPGVSSDLGSSFCVDSFIISLHGIFTPHSYSDRLRRSSSKSPTFRLSCAAQANASTLDHDETTERFSVYTAQAVAETIIISQRFETGLSRLGVGLLRDVRVVWKQRLGINW